ncbi:NAD(P)-dependent dehydrogenase (short-subunit alcohol dehydrogenase family) [Halarchaeum solikamskense]|uniref:SDR family NAD(P)-dependent oxidoreductase n=1 Tax=Halarchaeum nitratireducens TaxID=489913 RepID=UPI001B3AD929|nr:SDR family NAD(P)-dependent oxidoreductase [Halarchaeum solikamskense]MBP2251193.1 NAD(P)-dependent dehydrogenase (short-subunit alcohol dehydrogenase family) [Halarchaeum solikamskense]
MSALDLTGRTALVTGSATGVGRGIALSLAEAGAAVAVHYHSSEAEATATAAEARERGAPDATAVRADVTDRDSVDAAVEAVEADLGTVDVLVNNVGDFEPTHWAEQSVDDWRRVHETNLVGTMLCARRALPGMCEQEWGRIVNVGYASADRGLVAAKNFPYFAAKAGVLMFTRMLAAETQDDGVTVNAVSPYVVETSDEFPADAPRGRWATVDDIAHVVRFFCAAESGYVSGENVEVDGGWLPEDV